MVMASHLSQRLGWVDEVFVSRFTALIARAGLPTVGPKLGAEVYLHHMRVDKKAEAGDIKFVLIDKPGSAIVRGAPEAMVSQVIDDCCAV
jgi:3-dehydroquinate synthase